MVSIKKNQHCQFLINMANMCFLRACEESVISQVSTPTDAQMWLHKDAVHLLCPHYSLCVLHL